MEQKGNIYTGKYADMPTYLTSSHMYYANDVNELYGFLVTDNTPFKLAPSDQLSEAAVRTIIQNFLSAGDGVELIFNEGTGLLEIHGQSLTTDYDLHIDADDVIRNNLTEFPEYFVWNTGNPQTFTTHFDMVFIRRLDVNGQTLIREQYKTSLLDNAKEFEILDPLDDGDFISILYTHYIVKP